MLEKRRRRKERIRNLTCPFKIQYVRNSAGLASRPYAMQG